MGGFIFCVDALLCFTKNLNLFGFGGNANLDTSSAAQVSISPGTGFYASTSLSPVSLPSPGPAFLPPTWSPAVALPPVAGEYMTLDNSTRALSHLVDADLPSVEAALPAALGSAATELETVDGTICHSYAFI